MAIRDHENWDLSEKGIRDAQRHREKIDEQIRKNVKNIISEESIITQKGGKTVRIPVKGLKDFRFRHGITDDAQRGGVGQGKGKPGDVIARRPGEGSQPGQKAGSERGEEYMEVEVDIDYLIKLMFEDLGLPYIEEKNKAEMLVPAGWKFETISKVGIQPRIHKKRTLMESMKRTAVYVAEIIEATKCSQEDAERSLVQSEGELKLAIDIINEGKLQMDIDPNRLYIEDDDLRYRQIEQDFELHSNAAVIAMMDISGSMTPDKKYLGRSFLFWMVQFLKKAYNNVQIRFIVHTTEARVVDEDSFFKKGEWGGTFCHTAFDLANYMIETEFPIDMWNVYTVYISDGEDFDPSKTIRSVKNMLDKKINMLGYIEVNPESEDQFTNGMLLKEFRKEFNLKVDTAEGRNTFKNEDIRFVATNMRKKEDVYPALKSILFKKEGKK